MAFRGTTVVIDVELFGRTEALLPEEALSEVEDADLLVPNPAPRPTASAMSITPSAPTIQNLLRRVEGTDAAWTDSCPVPLSTSRSAYVALASSCSETCDR